MNHSPLLSIYLPPTIPSHICTHSAGVGRSGSLVTIDIELQRSQNNKCVDPFNTLTKLRQKRNYMIQTEAQYVFVHDAILEATSSGNTEIPVNELSRHMKELEQLDAEEESGYKKEFQVRYPFPDPPLFLSTKAGERAWHGNSKCSY